MDRARFKQIVTEVLNRLPAEFAAHLTNVEVIVDDEPTHAQIRSVGLNPREDTLFGLYEGVPIEERASGSMPLPDKITIFYRPIVEYCEPPEEIREEIRTTILHEVAHFFGIDDQNLDAWGY